MLSCPLFLIHGQDFAQKIKGYQEQIAALNTKCKMLTMKAKHTTMLLTVTEVEGLEELDGEPLHAHSAHPSVVMVSQPALTTTRSHPSPARLQCSNVIVYPRSRL